jgi:hypothetical protein
MDPMNTQRIQKTTKWLSQLLIPILAIIAPISLAVASWAITQASENNATDACQDVQIRSLERRIREAREDRKEILRILRDMEARLK